MTIPGIRWCGESHPHNAHNYIQAWGLSGVYTQCPGSMYITVNEDGSLGINYLGEEIHISKEKVKDAS